MNALFTGIYSHFNTANALNTSLAGQLYPHEAPESATYPYGVYYLISDVPEYDFSDDRERVAVQFSLFSSTYSSVEIARLYEELKALFDRAELTVAGFRSLSFMRDAAQLIRDEENGTWAYHVDYEALLERER